MASRNKPSKASKPALSKAASSKPIASKRAAPAAKPRLPVTPLEPLPTPQQLRARTRERAPAAMKAETCPKPAAKAASDPIWVWPSLIAILLLAFLLRIYGINFGLPHLYHGSETLLVSDALRGFGGDFHASALPYPALYTRFLSVVCGLPLLFGRLSGHYHSVQDFIVSYYVNPTHVLLWARLASALLGTLGVLLTFLIGRKIFGERVGLVGALLLAASAQQGAASHFAVPDVAQSILILAAYSSLYNVLIRGTRRDYVVTGLLIGLGAATGYMAALLLPSLLFAVLLRNRKTMPNSADGNERGQNEAAHVAAVVTPTVDRAAGSLLTRPEQRTTYSNLIAGLLAAILAFCVATPNTLRFSMSAWAAFQAGLASDLVGNGSGGAAYTLWQALTADWGTLALVAAFAGAALVLRARKAAGLLLLSFPVCCALALCLLRAQTGRVLVAVDPFVALFASLALCRLYDIARAALAERSKPVLGWKVAWTLLAIVVALPPLWTLLQWDSLLGNTPDTRTQALKWAEQNISPGSMVCLQTPRPAFQSLSDQSAEHDAARAGAALAPDWGANAPLLTEAGLARADVELSHAPFTDVRVQTDAALLQRPVYREKMWTWPLAAPALLQQAGVEYLFTSDACGPLNAAWQSQMEKAARGGILHFTPGSVASLLPPGLPGMPPRITVYILRDPAHP